MDKILAKYHKAQETQCFTNGLLAAQLIASRRMLEANTNGEVELLSKVMEDIVLLMEKACQSIKEE
jgi:hypothetical protein